MKSTVIVLGLLIGIVSQAAAQGGGGTRQGGVRPAWAAPARDARPQATGTARIRGRVLNDEGGTPVRRALVRLNDAERREGRTTMTDGEGRYEFKDLPAGRYSLIATKAGFVPWSYGQRRALERGKDIEVRDAETLARLDITLPRGAVILGRIIDEFGDPVADAMVSVMRERFVDGAKQLTQVGRPAQTNDIGQFRLFGLSPGDYYLSASFRPNGFGPFMEEQSDDRSGYAPSYFPGTPNLAEAQRLMVKIGQELTTGDFSLVPVKTARVSGTAVNSSGQPLRGIVMLRESSRGGRMFMGGGVSQTKDDGTFLISNVAPGEYVLEAHSRDGDGEFGTAPITVQGEDIAAVAVVTTRGVTISGQIVTDNGVQPTFRPDSIRINLMNTVGGGGGMMMAFGTRVGGPGGRGAEGVRDDWTFEVTGQPGPRRFTVNGLPSGWFVKSITHELTDMTDAAFEFKGNTAVSGVQIVLSNRASEVTGAVSDPKGKPVKEYSVLLYAEDSTRWGQASRFIHTGRPDQDGRFQIQSLPPETYLAVAVDSIPEGEWNNPEFLEQMRGKATKVTLAEGEVKSVDLKLVEGL